MFNYAKVHDQVSREISRLHRMLEDCNARIIAENHAEDPDHDALEDFRRDRELLRAQMQGMEQAQTIMYREAIHCGAVEYPESEA